MHSLIRNVFIAAFIFGLSSTVYAQTLLRGVVLDVETEQPIPNATLSINEQGIGEITDSKGRFLYRKYASVLDKNSALTVTADGYENLTLDISKLRQMYNVSTKIGMTKGTPAAPTKNNRIGIFYDISEGMLGRDPEREAAFLKTQLEDLATVEVEFVAFDHQVERKFQGKGDAVYTRFRESVQDLTYGGPSNYDVLKTDGLDAIYLFSNGSPIYGNLDISSSTPVYVVTSKPSIENQEELAKLVAFTSGKHYALERLGRTVSENISAERIAQTAQVEVSVNNQSKITGKVTSVGKPLQSATISLKGTYDEYLTEADGTFEIPAVQGDIIQVRYLGMFPKDILIEQATNYTIDLIPENEELAEVILEGKKKSDNTIKTANGEINEDEIGYAIDEISSESFNDGATSLRDLITGRFSGVTVNYNAYEGESYRIRGGSGSIANDVGPLWVVDGAQYSETPTFLDVQQIESIAVLKSLAATNRYGTLARGGVFVIKTNTRGRIEAAKKAKESALVKGNDYVEGTLAETVESTHRLLPQVSRQATPELQYKAFQQIARSGEVSLEFYSDAVRFFQKTNPNNAEKARADLAYIARNNTKAMRTLAYLYEDAGDYENAQYAYERVLRIAPQESQGYRDLANVMVENKVYNQALELYINMLSERIRGVNFSGIEPLLKTELGRLSTVHKSQIEFDRLPSEWLFTKFKRDIRMVIEWSDRSVPFEFQFVNPDNKFFKWKHTLEENRDRLEEEKQQGFQSEEFIIDDAPSGNWLVNVQYLGLPDDYALPPFLKYTVYKDYGTKNETKEIKIVKLFKQTDKVVLAQLNI